HFDEHRVLAIQPPGEPRQIGGAQPTLGLPVHDMNAVGIGQGQLVRELTGAVGAVVVDDQYVHIRARLVHASDDQRQGFPLVESGDDDQSALTRALSSAVPRSSPYGRFPPRSVPWDAHVAPSSLLRRPSRRTKLPLCSIAVITAAAPRTTSRP